MTVSTQTLTKIQSLARLFQTGYQSSTIDATIDKLVSMERVRLAAQADSLAEQLRLFEQKFCLSSEEFYRLFRSGELGDDADLFEWSAFYQMWLSARSRLGGIL